jgi:transmembrane sensor
MSEKKKYIDQLSDPLEMIPRTHIDWEKSKEQAWAELEKRIEPGHFAKTNVIFTPWMKLAVAAAFTLLIGISVYMQFYTKTIRVTVGQHSSIYLPDHSLVRLNAQSVISYKPLIWNFSRRVKFEGEAYFDVEQGKKFEVRSGKGKTIVLGTSFNVYTRNNEYQVTCVSGMVKVTANNNNNEVVLHPGQKAELSTEGILEVQSEINAELALSWLNNKLSFTSVSLIKVFEEISRQYGVLINIPENLENTYTGTFMRSTPIENALNLVCKPFNLKFIRKSKDEYIISGND